MHETTGTIFVVQLNGCATDLLGRLAARGYQTVAHDVTQALRALSERPCDAVLLGAASFGSEGTRQLAAAARARAIPVLLASCHADGADPRRSGAAEWDGVVEASGNLELAVANIEAHLSHRQPSSGPLLATASAEASAAADPQLRRAPFVNARILIMDDDRNVRETLAQVLQHLGYTVGFAESGEAAIASYREEHEAGRPFDAVIMDLTISKGMGGLETMQRLRAIHPGIKAIISSGYAHDQAMADYRAFGFCGVIPKPYTIDKLSELLFSVLTA
jgi:CheY-like chemotaxis protein